MKRTEYGKSRKRVTLMVSGKQAIVLCLSTAILSSVMTGVSQDYMEKYFEEREIQEDSIQKISRENSHESFETETVSMTLENTTSQSAALQAVNFTGNSGNTSGGLDVSGIASVAMPSVVSITNSSVQEVQQFYDRFGRNGMGPPELQETTSCGSGVIISRTDTELYIVTNYHVVEDADTLSVSFIDNTVYTAELCGSNNSLDLAVIKISLTAMSESTLSQIAVVKVGDSGSLKVGQQVVAIGNALGYGQSVTTGIVSALNRTITTDTGKEGDSVSATYIQTDAAINPGNSGGALLNMDGELIGINTAKTSSTEVEGMGYAIPISNVWEVIQNLMTQTTVQTLKFLTARTG